MPVIIFVAIAIIFHIALRYTQYGKYTYAIGGNDAGGAGVGHQRRPAPGGGLRDRGPALGARAGSSPRRAPASGQAGMGMSYELDAIAAAVIGGASLSAARGAITGTVIGTLILA